MKILLLVFAACLSIHAQTQADADKVSGWKLIPEASGPMTEYVGLSIQTRVAEIARDGDKVKLWIKFEFPSGAPMDLFPGFDVGALKAVAVFDCGKLTIKLQNGKAYVYDLDNQFIKAVKDKKVVGGIDQSPKLGHALFSYFCERPQERSKTPPKLKTH